MKELPDDEIRDAYHQKIKAAYQIFFDLVQGRTNAEENGKLHQMLKEDSERLNAIESVLYVTMLHSDFDVPTKMWYLQIVVELAYMLGYEMAQSEGKLTLAEDLLKSALKEI